MRSKKKLLKNSRLYAVIDKEVSGKRALSITKKIKDLGIDIIQFRDKISDKETILKDAGYLRKLLIDTKSIFIINDYLDIAKLLDCDGVHLGQDDLPPTCGVQVRGLPIEIARELLGPDKIIGISCHNLKQALNAQNRGADYISIGPVFRTLIKAEYKPLGLDLLKEISKKIKIPLFAIGGINENNINKVISSGVKRVAICRAICKARNITLTVKYFLKQFGY